MPARITGYTKTASKGPIFGGVKPGQMGIKPGKLRQARTDGHKTR